MNDTITVTKTNFGSIVGKIYKSFLHGENKWYIVYPIKHNDKDTKLYINSNEYKNQERILYNNVDDLLSDLHDLRSKKWK